MPNFARLQYRVNRATVSHLADARAQLEVGEPFDVLFDIPPADPFAGEIDGVSPQCVGSAEHLGGVQRGDPIVVRGCSYYVERAEPDGTGMVRLDLRQAAQPVAVEEGGDADP